MKYIYTILCIGLILIIWFAPIDLEREKQLANTGPRVVVIYLLESTCLKIAFTVIPYGAPSKPNTFVIPTTACLAET